MESRARSPARAFSHRGFVCRTHQRPETGATKSNQPAMSGSSADAASRSAVSWDNDGFNSVDILVPLWNEPPINTSDIGSTMPPVGRALYPDAAWAKVAFIR